MYSGYTPAGGVLDEKKIASPAGCGLPAGRRTRCDRPGIRPVQKGEFEHAQGRRYSSGFLAQILRRQRSERSKVERLSRKEECCPRVFHFCVHRWLNPADEELPGESENPGSFRHPGPGCKHG